MARETRIWAIVGSGAGILLSIAGLIPVINAPEANPIAVLIVAFVAVVFVVLLIFSLSERALRFFLEWIYGENYQISQPTGEEIEGLHQFAESHFGTSVTPAETIRSITQKYKAGLKIAKHKKNHQESVVGYIFYFPINKKTVDRIQRFEFSARDLSERDVASRAKYGHAFYVGAIAAKGIRAKAQMLGALKSHEDLAKQTKTKTIYARAASTDGLRILKKHGFKPVHSMADSVDCFFKKELRK